MAGDSHVLFREVQRFTQPWLWGLLLGLGLLVPLGIVLGMALGKMPVSSGDRALLLGIGLGIVPLLVFILVTLRMTVEVRRGGLHLGFTPVRRLRSIPLDGMTGHRVVTYRPIRDYGGWGIKGTRRGRAYNVKGNRGVRIDFGDGCHILIGSQEPERLNRAIEKMLKRRG